MQRTGESILSDVRLLLGGDSEATIPLYTDVEAVKELQNGILDCQAMLDDIDPDFMRSIRQFTLTVGKTDYTEAELLFGNDANFGEWEVANASQVSGTADGTTTDHLIDSGATFSTAFFGMGVTNTTTGATARIIQFVSATDLRLDADIFTSGNGYTVDLSGRGIRKIHDIRLVNTPFTTYEKIGLSEIGHVKRTYWSDAVAWAENENSFNRGIRLSASNGEQIELAFSVKHPVFNEPSGSGTLDFNNQMVQMNPSYYPLLISIVAMRLASKQPGNEARIQVIMTHMASFRPPGRAITVTETDAYKTLFGPVVGTS